MELAFLHAKSNQFSVTSDENPSKALTEMEAQVFYY